MAHARRAPALARHVGVGPTPHVLACTDRSAPPGPWRVLARAAPDRRTSRGQGAEVVGIRATPALSKSYKYAACCCTQLQLSQSVTDCCLLSHALEPLPVVQCSLMMASTASCSVAPGATFLGRSQELRCRRRTSAAPARASVTTKAGLLTGETQHAGRALGRRSLTRLLLLLQASRICSLARRQRLLQLLRRRARAPMRWWQRNKSKWSAFQATPPQTRRWSLLMASTMLSRIRRYTHPSPTRESAARRARDLRGL